MELFIIVALALTSVVSLAFILERGLALRWSRVLPPEVVSAIGSCRRRTDLPMLRGICQQRPSPCSRMLLLAIEHLDWPKEENTSVLETRARHEINRLERGLVVLEIITGIAPLMGLVGTIYGLIALFASLGQAGVSDNARFAQGIAIALNATLMGLLIAIPSLACWSYYSKKVETMAVELERLCEEFLRNQYRQPE